MRTDTESVPERAKISRVLLHVPHQASARVPTWHAKVRAPRTPFEIFKLKLALMGNSPAQNCETSSPPRLPRLILVLRAVTTYSV